VSDSHDQLPSHSTPDPAAVTTAPGADGTAPPPPENRFTFDGDNADLWPMTLSIGILNLLTLFFYRFWGRTRVRQYIWGRTSFLGDRLSYTGTGKEMFIGFLIVFFLILLPIFAASIYVALNWSTDMVVQMAFFYSLAAVSYFLFYMASYRALRYRLSRTNWRGIRGTQSGSALVYALKAFGWMILTPFSGGLLYPVQSISLTGTKLNNAWFGDQKVVFNSAGRSGLLYGPYMRAWLGYIFKPIAIFLPFMLLFGGTMWVLSQQSGQQLDEEKMAAVIMIGFLLAAIGWLRTYARYKARELAIMAPWITFSGLNFRFDADHNKLFRLMFGNMAITFLTLGFGRPFAQKRSARFITEHLTVIGEPDLDDLGQTTAKAPGMGEGLADAFDAGSI
jgi:uncharacterized membrane protein YjgN (DUF898 family)